LSIQSIAASKTIRVVVAMTMIIIGLAACDVGTAPAQPVPIPTVTLPAGGKPAAPAQPAPSANPPAQQPNPPAPQPAQTAAAIVNGQPIPLDAFLREVERRAQAQGLDPNAPQNQQAAAQIKSLVLDNMIDDVLVAQDAARQGVSVSDDELNTAMQQMIDASGGQTAYEQQLIAQGQTPDEARALQRLQMLYNKMRDKVIQPIGNTAEQVHARHILVDSQAAAEALLTQIQAGADFGQIAQQSSQDTLTKAAGGDLGWFPRGVLVSKEVEDAAFALQPGQVSGVVQSAFGFHIVQVLERDAARPVDQDTLAKMQQAAVEQWLAGLRAAAKVERLAAQ
jgi:parvulin-like peptidyl-prolyl isomerase